MGPRNLGSMLTRLLTSSGCHQKHLPPAHHSPPHPAGSPVTTLTSILEGLPCLWPPCWAGLPSRAHGAQLAVGSPRPDRKPEEGENSGSGGAGSLASTPTTQLTAVARSPATDPWWSWPHPCQCQAAARLLSGWTLPRTLGSNPPRTACHLTREGQGLPQNRTFPHTFAPSFLCSTIVLSP